MPSISIFDINKKKIYIYIPEAGIQKSYWQQHSFGVLILFVGSIQCVAKPYHSLKCLLLLQLALGLLLGLCRYASMRVYKQSSELDFQFHTLAQEKNRPWPWTSTTFTSDHDLFFVCFTQLPGPKVHQSTYQQSRVFGACTGASAKLGASASCSFSSSKLYGSKEGLQLVFLNWVCPAFQSSILI